MNEGTRECTKCGEVKPLNEFAWKYPKTGKTRGSVCQACKSKYHKDLSEKKKKRFPIEIGKERDYSDVFNKIEEKLGKRYGK